MLSQGELRRSLLDLHTGVVCDEAAEGYLHGEAKTDVARKYLGSGKVRSCVR